MENDPEQSLTQEGKPDDNHDGTGDPADPQYGIHLEFVAELAQAP